MRLLLLKSCQKITPPSNSTSTTPALRLQPAQCPSSLPPQQHLPVVRACRVTTAAASSIREVVRWVVGGEWIATSFLDSPSAFTATSKHHSLERQPPPARICGQLCDSGQRLLVLAAVAVQRAGPGLQVLARRPPGGARLLQRALQLALTAPPAVRETARFVRLSAKRAYDIVPEARCCNLQCKGHAVRLQTWNQREVEQAQSLHGARGSPEY